MDTQQDDFPPDASELPEVPVMGLIWELSRMLSSLKLVLLLRQQGVDARLGECQDDE